MKPFKMPSSTPTELGRADEWLRQLETVGSIANSEWTDEVRQAFFRWVAGSKERVGHVLFLAALRASEGQHQGRLLHEVKRRSVSHPSELVPDLDVTPPGPLRDTPERTDAVYRSTEVSPELSAVCESGADARTRESIRRFLLELRQIFSLTPMADFELWNAVYQHRPMEWEAMVSFVQDPGLRTGLVYGSVQSGKTSLLKHWSHYWLTHSTESGSGHPQRVESIYVDVVGRLGKALISAQERASRYHRREGQAPLGNGLGFEEILIGQCEAVLEETVVLEIQKRLAEYFRALLTGAANDAQGGCHEARAFSIPLGYAGESTRDTLDFRVTCCVVAVALWVARVDARRRTLRLVNAELACRSAPESNPQFADVFLELIHSGPRPLSAMLSAHDISAADGALWRSAYAACFDRAQPVLIFDNFEGLESEHLVHATVQASLNVAADVTRVQPGNDARWKVLIAVRDFTGMPPALASVPAGSWMAVGLTPRPPGAVHDNAMRYLPLSLTCKRKIVRSRLELALHRYAEAESPRLDTTTLLAELAEIPIHDAEGGGSDCIPGWLEETFEPVALVLCQLLRGEHEGRRREPGSTSGSVRKSFMRRIAASFVPGMRMLQGGGRSAEDVEDLIEDALLCVEKQRFEMPSEEAFPRWRVRNQVTYADKPQIREDKKTSRRRVTLGACFVSILAVAAMVAGPFLHEHVILPLLAEFRSPVGETPANICAAFRDRKLISLPDGSRLELDSGACVSIEITAEKRTVKLVSGEVIFQVAHDPRRPFVVETGPISIEDVGTEFDVFRRAFSTRVAVMEGAVQIPSGGTNPLPLTALQQVDVPDDTRQARVRKPITRGEFDRMTAWVHGDIVFENLPLKEVMEEFSRYQRIQFEFADPRIAEVRISGEFHVNDLESFLGLLKIKCIHSRYDEVAERVMLTSEAGKRGVCQ